jgi:replicative DNA helicase Mcm
MSSVDLSPGSVDRDNAEYLAEFIDRYYEEEIADLAMSDRTQLFVDIGDLCTFLDHDAIQKLRDDPVKYEHQLHAALRFCDSTRNAIQPETIDLCLVDDAGADIPHVGVSDVNSEFVKQYIGVTGQLAAVTKIRSFPRVAAFKCRGCHSQREVPQSTQEFVEPTSGCECEAAPRWELDYEASEWEDHRKLKIQQPPEDAANGETQHIAVHVFGEDTTDRNNTPLTERVGEDVIAYGTVELRQQDGRGASDYLFNHYLKGRAVTFEESGVTDVDIQRHRDEIEAHAAADDVYERFWSSLAPQIEPIGRMELAMKLSAAFLFGAPRIDPDDGPMYRGDIHIAIIGDPGMAKSVLLEGVAKYSPDAEHRSATGLASDVGLVAAAVEDDFGEGGWSLKPGILVRAGMHAVIDEIDKGPDKLEHINDALEGKQVATIDKAGMHAELKTRTGLMVSGNPIGSRFNPHEPLPNQIDVDESLLSRFDAIVLLIDHVDEEKDRKIGEHITESYREGVQMQRAEDTGEHFEQTVTDRVVSPEVGRAWVALGREIMPEFPPEIMERLVDFYVDARAQNDDENTISSTARQLEAGLRLSAAFARMRLSETVEECDVEEAITTTRALIGQTFDPESGSFDIDKLTTSSKSKNEGDPRPAILRAANENSVEEIAEEVGMPDAKVKAEIEKLMRKGELTEPRQGVYRST